MKNNWREIEERHKEKLEKRKIDTLIKYDKARICPNCGKLMHYAYGEVFLCDNCGQEEYTDFGKVRNYIDENGPSIAIEISRNTGVAVSVINKYLREGRIEIPDGSDIYIRCEDCGADIRYGRYCPACVAKHNRGDSMGFYIENAGEKPKLKKDASGKMHILDNVDSKKENRRR